MARTVRNPKIDTRSARTKLPARREPYWTVLSAGCALGYRRGAKGGTWIAKFRDDDGRQHYEALGAADDARDPDGLSVFSFAQAQERARDMVRCRRRGNKPEISRRPIALTPSPTRLPTIEPTICGAAAKRSTGSTGLAAAWIKPGTWHSAICEADKARIVAWHQKVAETPARLRTKAGEATEAPRGRRQSRGGAAAPLDREPGFDDPEGGAQSRAPGRQMRERRRVAHRARLPRSRCGPAPLSCRTMKLGG